MKDSRISRICDSNQRPFLQAKRGAPQKQFCGAPPFALIRFLMLPL